MGFEKIVNLRGYGMEKTGLLNLKKDPSCLGTEGAKGKMTEGAY